MSRHFMNKLMKKDIATYLKKRITLAFGSDSEKTIFYYFVGALAGSLDFVPVFSEFKGLILQINALSEL